MLLLQDQPVALVPAGPLHHCLEGSPPLMPHCLGLQTFGVTWAAVWMWSVLRISASGAPDNSHGYDHQPCIAVCNRLRVSVVLSSRRSVGARAGGGGQRLLQVLSLFMVTCLPYQATFFRSLQTKPHITELWVSYNVFGKAQDTWECWECVSVAAMSSRGTEELYVCLLRWSAETAAAPLCTEPSPNCLLPGDMWSALT
jgi:hypothetical protein